MRLKISGPEFLDRALDAGIYSVICFSGRESPGFYSKNARLDGNVHELARYEDRPVSPASILNDIHSIDAICFRYHHHEQAD